MRIIVTGGTGLVGEEVVRQAIIDDRITSITAIVRKPMKLQHAKLQTLIHKDFMDYTGLEDLFASNDAFFWCLGISQSQVNKVEYEKITYDYTIAAAEKVLLTNPNMKFLFLSGAGADNSEKSSAIFARIKGKAENKLKSMALQKLFIIRPGGIKPIHKNPNAAFVNKMMIPLYPLMEILWPSMVIASDILAKAMIEIAIKEPDVQTFENNDLKKIGTL